jgi:hypothetical protein
MAEVENHFTVFIRLPFNRGDFIDPPPVAWSAAKERALWDVISRQGQGKGNEIDWNALAAQFEVTQSFLLQQAAWLYERQLSQVRAQLKKVGNRQSATPSPAPGSVTSSVVGAQAMRRVGSGGSRAPSRLSTHHLGSPSLGPEGSAPPTPGKSRVSLPLRGPPTAIAQGRASSGSSRPLSRQPSKEVEPQQYSHSRRGSAQQILSRSPGQNKPTAQDSDSDDGEEQMAQSKYMIRRTNPSSLHRRSVSLRKERAAQVQAAEPSADDDDDDGANFLPFVADAPEALSRQNTASTQDPGATLRGGLGDATPQRPKTHRRSTSERITSPTKASASTNPSSKLQPMSASTSSVSSTSGPPGPSAAQPTQPPPSNRPNRTLSPRQQATLASAGLSPRRQGSESSPSMGSSFSDLDDASVTQSALEEALMSNMGNTTHTVASRVSGLSQALRSRYFDARQNERGDGR